MNPRVQFIAIGILLSAAGTIAALVFKVAVVAPAYTPLPGGGYGETFGPVASIRVPVYVACGTLIVAGLAVTAVALAARPAQGTVTRL